MTRDCIPPAIKGRTRIVEPAWAEHEPADRLPWWLAMPAIAVASLGLWALIICLGFWWP